MLAFGIKQIQSDPDDLAEIIYKSILNVNSPISRSVLKGKGVGGGGQQSIYKA